MNGSSVSKLAWLGKGAGFTLGFYIVAGIICAVALVTRDVGLVGALTAPLAVVCGAYYGGGAWKASAKSANGSKQPPA